MNENAYESSTAIDRPRKTQVTKWAIWLGVTCLLLAALCAVATVLGIMASFRAAAGSGSPRPADLAEGIGNSLIPAFGIVPLGLAGIVLLIIGFVVRRPASCESPQMNDGDSDVIPT